MRLHTLNRRRSSGFTLVELLVVIAIIATLAALLASAVIRVSNGQNQRRTEQNIVKIASALDQQWQAVISQAKKDTVPVSPNNSLYQNSGNDRDRAQAIWVKMRLLQEFPQTFAEATTAIEVQQGTNGPVLNTYYKPNYINYLSGVGSDTAQNQAAVCLYMALTQARAGMAAFNPEQALQGGVTTMTVGGLPFKVFVDSWGTPISYIRWPLGSAELTSTTFCANVNLPDPQDPTGKLIGFTSSPYQSLLHTFGAPYPRNLVPVIISAGADKQFGLDFSQNNGLGALSTQETDNIYSYRLRQAGGRGN